MSCERCKALEEPLWRAMRLIALQGEALAEAERVLEIARQAVKPKVD